LNRIFFRFFIVVMLSITVASFVIYFAINRLFGDPLDEIARRQASAQIFLLEQYVDKAPTDDWLVRLNKVRDVSDVRLDLIPLAAARALLPPGRHAALARGEVVLDAGHKALFRRVDLVGARYIGSEADVLYARGLPIDVGLALRIEAVRYAIIALVLLIPIALWSRSHWQSLQRLSQVADDVGKGRLAARAHLPRSAITYPLAERINHMSARIEALLAAQTNLLHSVSHELRTPIARLGFALELLRAPAADAQRAARIDAMEADLAELDALVHELLGMTRLDGAAALQRAPFALADALHACAAALPRVSAAPLPQWHLDDALGSIDGDRRLLERALGNLLRNAQKYAENCIIVSARRDGGRVLIVVEDDGPGIPEAERERVFDAFYRLDRSRDRATGGFGLGLSIARKAVALHGGSIAIDASPLAGARFTIVLPA
jgi:two-component system OmpR family sensor kinase